MEKTPFTVFVRYREVIPPRQYAAQEAEVTANFTLLEDADAEKTIAYSLGMVRRQVRVALGLEAGTLTAVASDPQKRGPGRPKKAEEPTQSSVKDLAPQTQVDPVPEPPEEDPKPAPASDDDFGDTVGEKAKEVTDAEVQEACRKAVADGKGALVAADVKNLARLKYGTDKVVAIKQEEREKFIADLKNLVAEKTKK